MYIEGKYKYFQDDLSDVFFIRRKVFQEELKVEQSLNEDKYDKDALFVVVYDYNTQDIHKEKVPVATGRLIVNEENNYQIGRVAVLPEKRGMQYGDMVVRMLVNKAFMCGADKVYVGAQIHAIGFYEKIGFKSCNEEYLDIGKKHLKMVLFKNNLCKNCNK